VFDGRLHGRLADPRQGRGAGPLIATSAGVTATHAAVFAMATAGLTLGCSAESITRSRFVSDHYCPADRVTVIELAPESPPAAPDTVASDPGRLAIWEEVHSRDVSTRRFDVAGCGVHAVYSCHPGVKGGLACYGGH